MASRFWILDTGTWDASDTTHWSATSGGTGGASVPGPGDTVTFDANSCLLSGTVTVATNFSVTSITMGAFTGTLDFATNNNTPTMGSFSSSGAGARTLNMGSGTWTVTGSGTCWDTSTATNFTLNKGTGTVDFTYAGASSRTFSGGGATTAINHCKISNGSGTCSHTSFFCNDFTLTSGYTGTSSLPTDIFGSLLLQGGHQITSSSSSCTFSATSSKTITTNGVAINRTIIFDGISGVWTLQDHLDMSGGSQRNLTLTNGTFNANNKNVTCGIFSSSNANTRVLTMGSGTWTITGNNATVWNVATTTGLTLSSASSTINFNYSGGTGTRAISAGNDATFRLGNVKVSGGGTDIFDALSVFYCIDLDFTGFLGSWQQRTANLTGNLTLGTGMVVLGNTVSIITFAATSGTKTITSNGVQLKRSVTVDGVGGTLALADSLNMGGITTGVPTLLLTNGTFNASNFNITTALFASSNANTRVLTMGSGTWTLTGTGTVWDMTTVTGLTVTATTSTIRITDTSSNNNTFAGGGKTFYNIWWNRGASTATNTMGGSTFNDLKDTGTAAHSLILTTGTTTTVNTFTVSGNAGKNITLASSTTTNATLAKSNGGTIQSRYMSVDYITGTPANTWFMGSLAEGSVDGGHNTTVYFTSNTAQILKGGPRIL